jgi:hypothetical protein
MNPELLCMGCMAETDAAAVCPYCAYAYDTPADSSVQLAPRTIANQKYVLGRVLGQGGFGITYLACDLETRRKLAIKEYFPAIISTRARDRVTVTPISSRNRQDLDYGLEKFHEEGQALYRFRDHPNVVTMLEFFHANGTGYIVMLYIEGCTFKEHLLSRGGRIPFAEALQPLTLVMHALEDLHGAGILHRDISPDNIYLENGGGVRILDFGATRYAMGEQSRSLSVVLKPGYAPEEQYRSRGKQGPWTDIYALGATFYRSITGRVPPESMDRQQFDDLAAPSLLGVDIPSKSEGALLKALAIKAENRFQSIPEFRHAVTPAVAPPPGTSHPTRLIFLPGFALLLALVLMLATARTLWGAQVLAQVLLFLTTVAFLFSAWKAIDDGETKFRPAVAAGLLLIPGFNLYWIFPALSSFAGEHNRFIQRHALPLKKLRPGLLRLCAASFAIYWLASILLRGPLFTCAVVLHACCFFPSLVSICNRVDDLKRFPHERAAPTQHDQRPVQDAEPRGAARLSLRCEHGEYLGQDIEIGDREIIMGRNPNLANLVLSSGEVSGRHLRVWRDPSSQGVWVEDLHSTNGTFYRTRGVADWSRLEGRRLLTDRDRVRISTSVAEFEVRIT